MPIKNVKETTLYELAELYKIFGDSTRVRILHMLLGGELKVQDLADKINMSKSAVSHQLRILKQAHLVKCRKDGKNVMYSLADSHVETILAQGIEHVME